MKFVGQWRRCCAACTGGDSIRGGLSLWSFAGEVRRDEIREQRLLRRAFQMLCYELPHIEIQEQAILLIGLPRGCILAIVVCRPGQVIQQLSQPAGDLARLLLVFCREAAIVVRQSHVRRGDLGQHLVKKGLSLQLWGKQRDQPCDPKSSPHDQ